MAVRLSSGSHRTKNHSELRPTAARTLESVFGILADEIEGRRVLDLYCGVGSYGILALRRGAASAVFVDNSRDAEKRALKAIAQFHLEGNAVMFREEVTHFLHSAERELHQYDLVFIDPPYQMVAPGPVILEILDAKEKKAKKRTR